MGIRKDEMTMKSGNTLNECMNGCCMQKKRCLHCIWPKNSDCVEESGKTVTMVTHWPTCQYVASGLFVFGIWRLGCFFFFLLSLSLVLGWFYSHFRKDNLVVLFIKSPNKYLSVSVNEGLLDTRVSFNCSSFDLLIFCWPKKEQLCC